jgi:hypothetical protein
MYDMKLVMRWCWKLFACEVDSKRALILFDNVIGKDISFLINTRTLSKPAQKQVDLARI